MIIDKNNNPWFEGKVVAEILEYKDTNNSIKRHIEDEDKVKYEEIFKHGVSPGLDKNYFHQWIWSLFFNFTSEKEEAKSFKKWVTKEVLLSIRKHVEYKIKDEMNKIIQIKDDYMNCLECITENAQETTRITVDVIKQRDEEIKNTEPNVPQTHNRSLLNMFALIKINEHDHYDYYVIRCQRRHFKSQVNKIKKGFPDTKIILMLTFNPNSINLYNRIKKNFKDKIN